MPKGTMVKESTQATAMGFFLQGQVPNSGSYTIMS